MLLYGVGYLGLFGFRLKGDPVWTRFLGPIGKYLVDVPLVVKDLEVKPVLPVFAQSREQKSSPVMEVFGKRAGKKQMKEKELFFYF